MRKLDAARYIRMPWKNGLGITHEIDREPSGSGEYLWRLSQAEIGQDGPFSLFPGFDRWLCLWKGSPVLLNEKRLESLAPIRFRGEEAIQCRLTGGAVSDVGLIFDREKLRAQMKIVEGSVEISNNVNYFFDLQSGDTLKFEQATHVTVPKSLHIALELRSSR